MEQRASTVFQELIIPAYCHQINFPTLCLLTFKHLNILYNVNVEAKFLLI